jgi:branched-chain amino acid transport system substrate-binding protein
MKRLTVVAVIVALLAAACGGSKSKIADRSDRSSEPIRIGVVGPMTGLAGFVGKNMVEGIQLAIDDINNKGGLLGRQVEFVTRDDEADPAKTATAVRELVEKEQISALFGPAGSTNYLAVSRTISDAQVPSWVISSGAELTDNVNPYAFRAFIPDEPEIQALAQYAAKKFSRIAILTTSDGEGGEFGKAVAAVLKAHGKTPVAIESFALDETDFSPIALKMKKAGADAVIMGTHLGLFASRFAVAKKNLDLDAQLLGVAGLINYTYPDLARAAADGTIIVSFRSWGHLPRDQWPPSVLEFYNAYVKRYLPDGEFSETGAYKAYSTNFLTYDMVKIWAAAVVKAGTADPKKVGEVLNNDFTYPADRSVIGVPWKYSATNHDGIEPGDLYFYTWDLKPNGKFELKFRGTVTDVLAGRGDL